MRYFRLFDFMSGPEGDLYRADGETIFQMLGQDGKWGSSAHMDSRAKDFMDYFHSMMLFGGIVKEVEAP